MVSMAITRDRILLSGAKKFSLDAYIASIGGSYWDFTKTDDQFQENVGPAPANAIGNVIGLKLDRGLWGGKTVDQVASAQPELLAPGSWSMSVNGGTGTATESPAGTLNLTGDGTHAATADQSFATVAGRLYRLRLTQATGLAGVRVGTTQGGNTLVNVTTASQAQFDYFFVATGTTTWVRFDKTSAALAVITAVSCKFIPGYAATQASATLKPTLQTTGAKYDGADDYHLTNYLAGGASNFVIALLSVPATISAFQYYCAAVGTSSSRFGLGINTDGTAGFAAGSISPVTQKGVTDLRSSQAVVGMTCDGAQVRGFVNSAQEYSGAITGAMTTIVPMAFGAVNSSGVLGSYSGAALKRVVAGREFLTLSRFQQISAALLAA